MLLRICLIVTILAGAGVIALSHFKVRPHVQEIIDARNQNAADRDKEKGLKTKALAELKATKSELDTTKATLAETQTQLASAKSQAESENKRANGLKQELAKTSEELKEKQQQLARWEQVGLDPSQVKDLIASEKSLRIANQGLDEEKKVFFKKWQLAKAELEELKNPSEEPEMPPGLRGKIVMVDPKWNFVVLNIGEKQGAVRRGVMMVSRTGRLIAKIRLSDIQPEKSIANIMPGWKLGEVMEGDQVLYLR